MKGKRKPPKPITWTHVDWTEYSDYLAKTHPKEYQKFEQLFFDWLHDSHSYGAYLHMENAETLGYESGHPLTVLSNWLFADYPQIADKHGVIRLWMKK